METRGFLVLCGVLTAAVSATPRDPSAIPDAPEVPPTPTDLVDPRQSSQADLAELMMATNFAFDSEIQTRLKVWRSGSTGEGNGHARRRKRAQWGDSTRRKRRQQVESAERAELLRVIRQLRADKSSAELEAQRLYNYTENCETETRRLKAEHARDVNRLRLEITNLDEDISNLRKLRREDIHDEVVRSKQDKDTLISEKQRLHMHIVELTNKTIEIHQENLKLHNQINKLNQLNTIYMDRLEDKNKENLLLQQSKRDLEQEIVIAKQHLNVCVEENEEIKKRKSKMAKEMSNLNQTLKELTFENDEMMNKSQKIRQEIISLTNEKLDLMGKFDTITELKKQTKSGMQVLREEIKNFTDVSAAREQEMANSTLKLVMSIKSQSQSIFRDIDEIKHNLNCHRKVLDLGMVYLGGQHYFFSDKSFKLSWPDAQTFCRSHGLELASVETEEENDVIVSHLEQRFSSSWSHHWLGLTDEDSEGLWKWAATGEPISFSAWGRHLPGGGTLENCASVFRYSSSDFRWCDHPCANKFPFVCELMQACN